LAESFRLFFSTNDVLLWLYLLFAISNAMMPSPSDRRAWPPVIAVLAFALLLLLLFGNRAVVLEGIVSPLSVAASYLALAFGLTIVIDLLFLVVIGVLEFVIGRIRGVRVQYE
jgi:hypothetical protein